MNVQVIEKNGQPEWAVIPYEEYEQFVEAMEMLDDLRAFDAAKQRIAAGEELVPSQITYAILDGANPIRVWRVYRGLTQQQLADQAGIRKPYLSQLESGKRTGTTEVLNSLAQALGLTLEDLLP
jgi:DNA-binding XRE family transcriptional regulator